MVIFHTVNVIRKRISFKTELTWDKPRKIRGFYLTWWNLPKGPWSNSGKIFFRFYWRKE